jgi:hypothetical protein
MESKKTCGRCRKKAQRLLRCDCCSKLRCWNCALHFERLFGPSHPDSGWSLTKNGDPRYLVFRCGTCAKDPANFGALRLGPAERRDFTKS